jgi:hypothetical protein
LNKKLIGIKIIEMNNKSLQRISILVNQIKDEKLIENNIIINNCSNKEVNDKIKIEEYDEIKKNENDEIKEDFTIETGIRKLDFDIIFEKKKESFLTLNNTNEKEKKEDVKEEKKEAKKEENRYLTITDSETGKTIKVPIFSDSINASELKVFLKILIIRN